MVLIHGSGQTDRTTLRSYAEAFAGLGVAALTYDKRGVGKSEGAELAWREFSFTDLAGDATAALRYLRSRRDIDTTRLGVFGVSQGGWIAPLAAGLAPPVKFLVLISASVSTVAEDNLFERDMRLRSEGFNEAAVGEVHAMHLVDLEVSRSRFFGGLSEEETAEALGVTARTVRRDWVKAKGLLYGELSG